MIDGVLLTLSVYGAVVVAAVVWMFVYTWQWNHKDDELHTGPPRWKRLTAWVKSLNRGLVISLGLSVLLVTVAGVVGYVQAELKLQEQIRQLDVDAQNARRQLEAQRAEDFDRNGDRSDLGDPGMDGNPGPQIEKFYCDPKTQRWVVIYDDDNADVLGSCASGEAKPRLGGQ